MRILSNVTMSSNVSMASNAKDQFTIGSELERDNANADDFKVWANTNFYNDVTIGSSSADVLTVRAGTFNLSGTALVNNNTTNLYVSKQGSDTNTGLAADSGSALLTIQAAVDKLALFNATTNNRNTFHVTINIASGTYEEKVNLVNKGIGKSDSNLLVKFVGAREILYSSVPTTGALTTDPDLGFDNSIQCGLVLNFTGSVPAPDVLKGCFLISSDGYRTAVINHHSGNNFYANSVGFGFNDTPQTVNIVRPAVEIKGLFRTAGVNGAIAFDTLKITGLDDGEDCFAFGGFSGPPTSLEYTSLDKYRSVFSDEIVAYNCQVMVTGTVDVVLPPNFQFINGYIFSNENSVNQRLTLTNYIQADQLKIIGSFIENAYLNLYSYKYLDFSGTDFLDNLGGISRVPSCIGPKKIKYSSVGGFITLGDVGIDFLPNYICKSGYLLVYGGSVRYYPSSYFIGPFNRIIDGYKTSIDFTYGGNGPPTGSHYFSGSLEADRLFILNDRSSLSTAGTLDLSNVYIPGAYPLFYVNNSKLVHNHALPITASITSSNYVPYDVQLDDVATYKYTDFPVVNQQGSLLDNRLVYYDIKTETKIPFFAEDVTILDSITSNNGYKVNGNFVVGEAEYDISGFAGQGAYESGSKFTDAFGNSSAEIIIGRLSGSNIGRNNNIIDIYNGYSGISVWDDGIDFYSPDGFVSLQQIINTVQGGGGGGSYADSVVQQVTQSYEQYDGGSGSYFSGTMLVDGQNQTQNAFISIGHTSASNYNLNSDILELAVSQTRVRLTETGIDFSFGTSSISIDQIYSTVNGGGGNNLTVQSSGSGQNLVADYNNNNLTFRSLTAGENIYFNGNGGEIQINASPTGISSIQTTGSGESIVRGGDTLRSLKSTSTVNVIQQTNELELEVNSNLTLTSLTLQGGLAVSGNVQLGDQSSDVITSTAQLTASNGINTTSLSASSTLQAGGTATFGSNLNIYGNLGTSNGANQTKTIYAECTNGTIVVGGDGTTVSGSKAQFASLNLNSSQIETAWSSYNVSWTSNGTQPSLGNGTLTGHYKQIGKTVFVRVKLDWGSTTTGGTGDWRFSLPVSAVSSEAIQMPCSILDNGNAWYQATVNGRYSGLTDRSSLIGQSSVNNSSQGITSTFPITWGDGDSLQFNGSYEAA